VNSDIASEKISSADDRGSRRRLAVPDRSAPRDTYRLSPRGALIVISAASLGLWAAIAAAISALAAVLVP
jgi:hypothetical protein